MKVKDLIKAYELLPQDDEVLCALDPLTGEPMVESLLNAELFLCRNSIASMETEIKTLNKIADSTIKVDSENYRLKHRLKLATSMLKEIEFSSYDGYGADNQCPFCREEAVHTTRNGISGGHKPDCRLEVFLKG